MNIPAKRWTKKNPPKKILAIRLQAMGDLVITLPYLQSLKKSLPGARLDLLTREEVEAIPRNIHLFDNVYSIGGRRNFKKQFALTCFMLPKFFLQKYDVVLDLQNTLISKLVRKAALPKAWSEFDKISHIAAGERTRLTIEAAGFENIKACYGFSIKSHVVIDDLLKQNGWNETQQLVVLNPAGAFETRNWPLENYVTFTQLWLNKFPQTQFLMPGTDLIKDKAAYLKEKLSDKLIDLTCKTTPPEVFAVIQKAKFALSEDSGLMHMAWVSGVPTLAMFGSTRSYWSAPLGKHSLLLDSSDLPCGNCMLEKCLYGDTHCLTRYTPEFVFEKALSLIQNEKQKEVTLNT
jgi:ADP-heptose:LPS heptosyltransferase